MRFGMAATGVSRQATSLPGGVRKIFVGAALKENGGGSARPNLQERIKSDDGFTLVEVLAAVAILSLGLSVLLSLIGGSLSRTGQAEKMFQAVSLAQSLIAEVSSVPMKEEEKRGQFSSGYRWRLKIRRYEEGSEQTSWPVGAYTVSAAVSWFDGNKDHTFELTTLKIGEKGSL